MIWQLKFMPKIILWLLHFLIKLMLQNSIEKCPVLQPTLAEFENFSQYAQKIGKIYQQKYGMVKIVPPSGWKARSTSYDEPLNNLIIKNPIQQNPEGKMGVYQFKHISLPSISYLNYIKEYQGRENNYLQKTPDQTEQLFWKSLAFNPPVYGADLLGTLMQQSAGSWQLNQLDTILKKGLQKNVRGVTTSYCYIGSWKALFCWHKQDLDLEAINFLHFGKSKFWYCIQTDDSNILERQAKKYFFKAFDDCPQYLRHKTSMINPYMLKKLYPKLKISKIQQRPGQFIIAFSGAYHCGFNFGINVAEAVNFATINWLQKLIKAKHCRCKNSSVKIQTQSFINKLLQSQQYKNNQTVKSSKQLFDKLKKIQNFNPRPIKNITQRTQIETNNHKTKHIAKNKQQIVSTKMPKKYNKDKMKLQKDEMQTHTITQIQCDLCQYWHQLPQNLLFLTNEPQFNCHLLGKDCYYKKEGYSKNIEKQQKDFRNSH